MNFAYLHLAVNHLPIVGTGIALLLVVFALVRRDDGMLRGGLAVVILSGLGAVPAVQSGERAEEQAQALMGTNRAALESHEEMAETAQWIALIASLVALLAFLGSVRPGRLRAVLGPLKAAVLVSTALTLVAMVRTAQTGGRIRHPEVEPGLFQGAESALEEEGVWIAAPTGPERPAAH